MKNIFTTVCRLPAALLCAGLALAGTTASAEVVWSNPKAINSYAAIDSFAQHDVNPAIATDNNGNWVALWSVAGSYSNTLVRSESLRAAHSTDQGQTWSDPYTVFIELGYLTYEPSMVYGGNGTWLAYWTTENLTYVSSSTNFGKSWSAPREFDTGGGQAYLESDGNGVLLLMRTGITGFMRRSTDYGQTWTEISVPYPPGSTTPRYPLASGGGGKWYLAYATDSGFSLLSSQDNGDSWQTAGSIPTNGGGRLTDLSADGDHVVAATTRAGLSSLFVSSSVDGANTFQLTTLDGASPNSNVSLSHDAAGNWVLLANGGGLSSSFLKFWRSANLTDWTFNGSMPAEGIYYGKPAVASSGSGQFVAVWHIKNDNLPLRYRDADIQTASTSDAGNTWSVIYLNNNALIDSNNVQDKSPKITGHGNTLVASWTSYADDLYNPLPDVQKLHVSTSMDGGQTWSLAQQVADEVGRRWNLAPEYNGAGQWLLPWFVFQAPIYRKDEIGYVASSNNGATWEQPKFVPGNVIASNANRVVLTATSSTIHRSFDNGHSWETAAALNLDKPRLLVHVAGSDWLLVDTAGAAVVLADNGNVATPLPNRLTFQDMTVTNINTNHNGHLVATATAYGMLETYLYTSHSTDGGVTWSQPVLVHTARVVEPVNPNDRSAAEIYHETFWLGGDQWIIVNSSRTSYLGFLLGGPYYRGFNSIHFAYTSDNGASWTPAEHVLDLPMRDESSMVGLDMPDFALVDGHIAVADARRFAINVETATDFDIYLQITGATPQPPPPNEPPGPPPPPNGPAPNLSGAWAPANAKYKTNKKGIMKGSLTTKFLIQNTGDLKVEDKSITRFYLSHDAELNGGDVELKPKKLKKITPGKGKTAKVKLKKLSAPVTGQHLIAVIDADHNVPELNEADNIVVSDPLP